MPKYDNYPKNEKIEFDSNPQRDTVFEICGCDPTRYFEFNFRNVKVTRVTYNDGSAATEETENDSIIGRPVLLNAIMPDVSPSAVCGQLFAANMKVGNLLAGTLQKAIQSDLRVNLRPLNSKGLWQPERAGAHFETYLDITDKTSPEGSLFLKEIGNGTKLEFYMHVNRYTYWGTTQGHVQDRLSGDVYGYIRPVVLPVTTDNGTRVKGRHIIADPDIAKAPDMKNIFVGINESLMRIEDIDGTYDLLKDNGLLILRYLDFIPLLDRCNNTPTDKGLIKEYIVSFTDRQSNEETEIGRFKGDYNEMQSNGGILVFRLPTNVLKDDDALLLIKSVDKDGNVSPLMKESDWDIVLESDRGLTMGSDCTEDVTARVYYMNKPYSGREVRLLVQPEGKKQNNDNGNTYSPIVAKWDDIGKSVIRQDNKEGFATTSDNEGIVRARVKAINLEHSAKIFDPVTNQYLEGDLPWDRYYGNYLYFEIDNDLRIFQSPSVEQIEISVRVLHTIKPENIRARPTFKKDISKLFSYYLRYFPWLHTIELPEVPREVPQTQAEKRIYFRFRNLESYDQIKDEKTLNEILRRLNLDNNQWDKMPRSRDFPKGGPNLIKRWQDRHTPN